MTKLLKIALLILISSVCYGQTQVKSLWAQPGGLSTAKPGYMIDDQDFTDMGDVFTDNGSYIQKRGGLSNIYSIGKSYPINQIYENVKVNGTRYGIIKSSGELGYIDTANTYRVLLTTLSSTSRLWQIQYNDACYLGTDSKEDIWKFDPTASNTLEISTYIPKSKYPLIYFDKMFAINISTPLTGNGAITTSGDESVIRYSRVGDLRQWDGDFWIGVNRNDGDTITGSVVYRGNLYVYKTNSTHQIMRVENEDNTDGERAVQVLANIGCISADTIKEVNGLLYWVSAKGVIEFNGTSYKIISEDIKGDLDTIIKNDSNGTQSIVDTTQSDFAAGTSVNCDTTTYSGSVVLSAGQDIINQQNTHNNQYYTSNQGVEIYQTFMTSYTLVLSTITLYIQKSTGTTEPVGISIKTNSGVLIGSQTVAASNISSIQNWYPINFYGWGINLTSGTTYRITIISTSTASNGYHWYGDESVSYDKYNRGNATPPFWFYDGVYQSGDFAFKIYQNYYGSNTFGSFASQKRETSKWVSWSNMGANYGPTTSGASGTNVIWYISATTATALCNTNNMVLVSTGTTLTISSGTWVLWYASMTTTDIGVSPKIDDVTLNYLYTGNKVSTLYSYSDNFNLRYWLTGRGSLSLTNNIVYAFQLKNNKWTKHNLNVNYMTDFKGDMVMGGSALTGKIYKYSDEYTTDDGTAIAPYIKSKDYLLSSRMQDCKIGEIWYYASPSIVYSSMTATYYPNLKNTAWNIQSDIPLTAVTNYDGMFVKKKVYVTTLDRVRCLSIKIEKFEKLLGLDLTYQPQSIGER